MSTGEGAVTRAGEGAEPRAGEGAEPRAGQGAVTGADGSDPFGAPDASWSGVSPRLATARRIVAAVLTIGAASAVLVVARLTGWSWLTWVSGAIALSLAWTWWFIDRQVRAWGYAERGEELLIRRGRLWQRLTVVPYGRLQYVDVAAGPLARSFGLADVKVHTASASSDAVIPGLPASEAAGLRDRLTARGRAQLSGL